jgi:SP family facilitated glucose transporter-like MFS transporter 3
MQHREGAIKRVISHASCHTLLELEQNELRKVAELDNITQVDVDEIIFTLPLIFSVLVAIIAQFLVGYNTGVMNAPESVVFPSHTTTEWSIAVSAFAIGGPGIYIIALLFY